MSDILAKQQLHQQHGKRSRGTPTGETPIRTDKKRPTGTRRSLLGQFSETWSDLELSALVEFILMSRDGNKWPMEKTIQLWDAAARHVKQRAGSATLRTGEMIAIAICATKSS